MSPYGGVIQYWTRLLEGLSDVGLPVLLRAPRRLRATIPRLAKRGRKDASRWVFHSTYLTTAPAWTIASVFTLHDLMLENGAALPSGPHERRQKRTCIEEADAVITPSLATARHAKRWYPDATSRIGIVPHGIDPIFWEAVPSKAQRAATALRQGSTRPYLLHVGGREQYKNFSLVLSAYLESGLCERFDLLVVGSQPFALSSELVAIDRGRPTGTVRFLGYAPQPVLAALYRDAAVYVTASLDEGFGLPACEAMASGTPVAHSAIPVFDETVGPWGFSYDPKDRLQCVAAITAAAKCESGRRRSGQDAMRSFKWRTAVERTLAVYARVIATGDMNYSDGTTRLPRFSPRFRSSARLERSGGQ